MKGNISIPEIVSTAKENNHSHVFFVNSPITAIVTRLIIEKYNLQSDKIIVVSIRDTDTAIIDYFTIKANKYLFDKILFKLFKYNLIGKRILHTIKQKSKEFIIYSAWYYDEVKESINSKNCKGHIYFEEGQLSNRSMIPISIEEMLKENKSDLYLEPNLRKNYFLDTAKAYIGISPKVFPQISQKKRYILDNYSDVLKYYKPKLIGVKNVGLTCAERRINGKDWRIMIDTILAAMSNHGVIKLHPSFSYNKKKIDLIKSYTKLKSGNKVKICSFDTIIEIEMIHEPKNLIGPLTSLREYSVLFGSTFQEIKLY